MVDAGIAGPTPSSLARPLRRLPHLRWPTGGPRTPHPKKQRKLTLSVDATAMVMAMVTAIEDGDGGKLDGRERGQSKDGDAGEASRKKMDFRWDSMGCDVLVMKIFIANNLNKKLFMMKIFFYC